MFPFTLTFCFTLKERATSPSTGSNQDVLSHGIQKNGQDKSQENKGNFLISVSTSRLPLSLKVIPLTARFILTKFFFCFDAEVCGFCRKPVDLSEPAIEALNRTYHDGCFQCRSCHIPLAGKQYYNKAGIPLCADCYQVIKVSSSFFPVIMLLIIIILVIDLLLY